MTISFQVHSPQWNRENGSTQYNTTTKLALLYSRLSACLPANAMLANANNCQQARQRQCLALAIYVCQRATQHVARLGQHLSHRQR